MYGHKKKKTMIMLIILPHNIISTLARRKRNMSLII